ncbi:MAG: AAA family ATPase [Cyanobacteriota bacterium]|nr:AAA family ATPase [Cyanobacteriota bacterium]
MLNLTNYQQTDQIYIGTRTLVYKAVKETDTTDYSLRDMKRQPVIIKILRNPYPNFNELVQFRNQYAIASNLEHPAVVKPLALEDYGHGYALVMPDNEAISLPNYWQYSDRSLTEFLIIAIQLAEALHYLNQKRIIHKDIKPGNILIHPENFQVKLIDFSISSLLPKEQQQLINPNVLEGTLAYISPEQTGRMNRGIDYRTDFYSLGVTFFELLTGKLPFETNDLMELVHCHIAQTVEFPANSEQLEIPEVLKEVVLKLMKKNPEERYQSALGLKHDLERCLEQWKTTGDIIQFELGEQDICDRFLIPEKLYGREREVAQLLAAFERVSQGDVGILGGAQKAGKSELLLVAGFSGIGKTAVVNEVHKPIVKQRGYFIKGKFDQFNRNIPFSAFLQAFRDLMGQLLGESDADLANWRGKILKAVGESGQVIIDVIPELERIIGKQPPVPELSGSAAQNRFNLLFGKFVQVFATKEHPLVIFLDDLQWADSASFDLLKLLMDDSEAGYLLVLGAYRDNEVFPAHPLMLTLDEITKQGANINTITLAPLDETDVTRLVADTLLCSVEIAVPLSELVYPKTKGNPFFTTQFLRGLHEDGYITFDVEAGYWQCDLTEVWRLVLTDDVVTFMVGRLQKLPAATQAVLKLAACIGNQFDLGTLAVVCESTQEQVATDLWRGLQEGFIIPESQTYKFFHRIQNEKKELETISVNYRFLHDRVQQAAYSLITEEKKQATHLEIGILLLEKLSITEREERMFEIVNHLNIGRTLITKLLQREELAKLNLSAGTKAKASTAYAGALSYIQIGIELLPDDCWRHNYQLSFSLYKERAEVEYLNGNIEAAEMWIERILQNAHTPMEKAEIYNLSIIQYTLQAKYPEAIQAGRRGLALINVDLPEENFEQVRDAELAIATETFKNLSFASLTELPLMTEPEQKMAIKLLITLGPPTYRSHQRLWSVICAKAVNLCLKYGNTPEVGYIYPAFGGLRGYALNNYQNTDKLLDATIELTKTFNNKSAESVAYLMIGSSLRHWSHPLKVATEDYLSSYRIGLESSNLQYAAYAFGHNMYCRFYQSIPLEKLLAEISESLAFTQKYKNQWAIDLFIGGQMLFSQLMGTTTELVESEYLQKCREHKNWQVICIYKILKTQLLFFFDRRSEALECCQQADAEIINVAPQGLLPYAHHLFIYALLMTSLYPSATESQKLEYGEKISTYQKQLAIWAKNCPENFLHLCCLVEAEMARIAGKILEAIELYDRAISVAKENKYLQQEALGNELAAKFYLNWGKEKIAATYMQEAYYCYARWGAKAKTDQLEQKYPQLLAPILNCQISQSTDETMILKAKETISNNSSGISENLDLATIIKASHALSEEIELNTLLSKLMHIVLENAGADTGALILDNKSGNWEIAAKCDRTKCDLSTITLDKTDNLPISIINTVKRTQHIAIVNNIEEDKTFTADPYLIQQPPKSLCCTPIINQGKLIGILYLENNLTAEAFTPEHIEILNLLTAQAAISIENAQLYQRLENYNRTLEQQVAERTEELQQKNQQLTQILQELKTTQDELIQSGKMAALGQLVAGIAHEINTPLGAIRAAIGNTDKALEESFSELPQLLPLLNPQQQTNFFSFLQLAVSKQPSLSTREKRQIKRTVTKQLESHNITNAKQLSHLLTEAGLHHSVESQISLLQTPQVHEIVQIAYDIARLYSNSQNIFNAVERASKIVFALKSYARYDHSGEKQPAVITDGIETVLEIYHNYLKKGVEVIRYYQDIPEILCYPDELVQVWTNLIHNGIQAMDGKGKIDIEVRVENQNIVVGITDSGAGIPLEIQDKIFQPFFTTKPAGEGSGLGLEIVKNIIDKHQGKIDFTSVPGKTTFTVTIPIEL